MRSGDVDRGQDPVGLPQGRVQPGVGDQVLLHRRWALCPQEERHHGLARAFVGDSHLLRRVEQINHACNAVDAVGGVGPKAKAIVDAVDCIVPTGKFLARLRPLQHRRYYLFPRLPARGAALQERPVLGRRRSRHRDAAALQHIQHREKLRRAELVRKDEVDRRRERDPVKQFSPSPHERVSLVAPQAPPHYQVFAVRQACETESPPGPHSSRFEQTSSGHAEVGPHLSCADELR